MCMGEVIRRKLYRSWSAAVRIIRGCVRLACRVLRKIGLLR